MNPFSWATDTLADALCVGLNVACREPPKLFDQPGGLIFFFMLAFSNIFVLLLFVSVLGGFVTRLFDPAASLARTLRDPRAHELAKMQREVLGKPSLTVLLPCYLPNEQPILMATIEHIIEKLEYGYPFRLIVCYNTPKPMDFEHELQRLDDHVYPNGRSIQILKIDGSKSKAQNLNRALDFVQTEHVALYDADHHPDPHSLLIATAHMAARGVSCVQGSTYLRSRPNLMAVYINAEFFVTHFVFFPAMQFLTSIGVFGGSNALWKTRDLKAYQFRHDVQTEDIEFSIRSTLEGRVKISFCPESRSGELPPSTFRDLYKQRLRWALGWDQVTLQHASSIPSAKLHCAEKAGLYYILPLRWGLLFSATLNALVAPIVASAWAARVGAPGQLGGPIETCYTFSFSAFVAVCVVVVANAVIHEPWQQWPAVLIFQLSGILYLSWQLLLVFISLSKICSGTDGGWVVTTRAADVKAEAPTEGTQSSVGVGAYVPPAAPPHLQLPAQPSPLQAAFGGSNEDLALSDDSGSNDSRDGMKSLV